MTKLQLAQKRNHFKFVLDGMYRQIDFDVLTLTEIENWNALLELRQKLIDNFNSNSKYMGLKVPKYRCWCGKEGKYDIPEDYPFKTKAEKFCKKHFNEIIK